MSFLDRFKKKEEKKSKQNEAKVSEAKKQIKEKKTLKPKSEVASAPALKEKVVPRVAKTKKDDTKNAYRVLVAPVVTEKATDLVSKNKYVFEVAKFANKIEVKKAIKNVYGFAPLGVRIINVRGKNVISGRMSGKRSGWKKAIVTLKKGDKIEIYEGV
jgi:large subunit ribosomal protein L23